MEKRRKTILIILSAVLVVWCMLAMYLRYSIESDPVNSFTVKISEGESNENMDISVVATKHWYNDKYKVGQTVGAQYDGTISSRYEGKITEWKLIITLSEEGKLDSYWNGEYILEGNKLTIIPDVNTKEIFSDGSRTFGFVMITEKLLEFEEFELVGSREMKYTEQPLYWFLVFYIAIWIMLALSYVIAEIQTKRYEERRKKDGEIILQTMRTFAGMIDAKDPYTSGHSLRVASYSQELARRMNIGEEEIRNLGYIALMHDCGKMGINDSVLTKPGSLTPEERKFIQEHTVKGGHVLENFTAIEGIKEGALYHHERYDGTGYPYGLKGEEIPLCARIICVADAYDAMNTRRCYRSNLPKDVILDELEHNKGTQFDPEIAKHMIDMIHEGYCSVEDILA